MTSERRGIAAAFCLAFALSAGLVQINGQSLDGPGVTEACLGCICEAVSNCNSTLTCSGDVCGLFRITWAYWSDAGKPVLDGDDPSRNGAYASCVTEPYCAAKAVRGYMAKFAQDCDGNGVIGCSDYSRVHLLGGYGCNGGIPPLYYQRFTNCVAQVAALTG